jgi:hypothetical protein
MIQTSNQQTKSSKTAVFREKAHSRLNRKEKGERQRSEIKAEPSGQPANQLLLQKLLHQAFNALSSSRNSSCKNSRFQQHKTSLCHFLSIRKMTHQDFKPNPHQKHTANDVWTMRGTEEKAQFCTPHVHLFPAMTYLPHLHMRVADMTCCFNNHEYPHLMASSFEEVKWKGVNLQDQGVSQRGD